MGYLLIFFKTIANISESVLIKKYNAKHSSGEMFFTGVLSVFAMLFFIITDKNGFNFPTKMLPYAIFFGIIYCISYLFTFVAFSCGSFTLSMLIISYSLIFPILYGIIWLNDTVTPFSYIGFFLLMISLFLVRTKDEQKNKISAKWLIAIIITTVGNGLLAIIQKVQQVEFDNSCNNEFMIIAIAISAAVLLTVGIIKDRKDIKEVIRYGVPYAGLAGISNGLNNFLLICVNTLLPLSIVSPLCTGAKIVMSFITGQFMFKEEYNKRQIIGVIIGTISLVFLSF